MTTVSVTVTDSGGHVTSQTVDVQVDAASSFDQIVTGDQPNGFTVPAGQNWKIQGLVTTPKNVVVNGTLTMRAGDTLRFRDVVEANFVGGGLDPIASDVGLWVMGNGMLDACGTDKVGWNRTGNDPTWLATDEIRVCPTAAADYTNFATFVKGSAVPTVGHGMPSSEVFNLTRDCNIEGTATGRAHVFIRSMMPQMICHTGFRYLGPNKAGKFVLGRWGLHFHNCMSGSVGSRIESCVVRDTGSHCYVPHMSDGITFVDCVSYNGAGDHYWWDTLDFTNNTTFDHCLAAYAPTKDPDSPTTQSGFLLGRGDGNVAKNCAAVGVGRDANGGGFNWPERAASAIWVTDDCVAHNNPSQGGQSWQNQGGADHPFPIINRFIGYRNGKAGFAHGAYVLSWKFNDCAFYDNGAGAITQAAQTGAAGPIVHLRAKTEGPTVKIVSHSITAPANVPGFIYQECAFTLFNGFAVENNEDVPLSPGIHNPTSGDFVRCTANGGELEPAMFKLTYMREGGVIRVQRNNGTAYQITSDGTNHPVTTIPAFA